MIIVSQDKEEIINLDNIQRLFIDADYISTVIYAECIEDDISIGMYKTEERAKEVLQEIAQKYSSYLKLEGGPAILQGQMDIQPNIFNIPKVFEMPED
jgi:hypothetical protein